MENVKKLEENSKTNNILKILKGSLVSIILTLILLLITSLILTYTNVSENISILIGSILSSMNIKKNGLLNGALVGGIYMIAIYILSSVSVTGYSINTKTFIMLAVSILAGIIGGIIGVNIHK